MTTRVCPSCGERDYGTPFCVSCQQPFNREVERPAGTSEILELEAVPEVKAGFLRRFVALAIDWLVLSIIGDIVRIVYTFSSKSESGVMEMDAAMILSTLIFLLYFTFFLGEGGQTLGKMILGIRVQRLDGKPMDIRCAFIRTLGYFLSFFFMTFLGFLWALWDKENQTWHDKIAGTEVVRS